MRTTLSIDDDVLTEVKAMATRQHKSIGEVISAPARQTLRPDKPCGNTRNGVPLLSVRADATPVTPELVNQLRDGLP